MFYLAVAATARIHRYLRCYAPTNLLLDWLRSRRGLKWAIPAAIVLVPGYLYAASICTTLLDRGGPGWLNLLALLFIWNALKFAVMGPISLVLLTRRLIGRRRRPRTRFVPMGYKPGRSAGPWTRLP